MMSQTSQVYAHLNEPTEKPEISRFSETVSRGSNYVRHQTSQIRMPEFIMAFLLLFGDAVPGLTALQPSSHHSTGSVRSDP